MLFSRFKNRKTLGLDGLEPSTSVLSGHRLNPTIWKRNCPHYISPRCSHNLHSFYSRVVALVALPGQPAVIKLTVSRKVPWIAPSKTPVEHGGQRLLRSWRASLGQMRWPIKLLASRQQVDHGTRNSQTAFESQEGLLDRPDLHRCGPQDWEKALLLRSGEGGQGLSPAAADRTVAPSRHRYLRGAQSLNSG